MNYYPLIIVFLNLIFLIKYSWQDIKTHTVPRIATLGYVIASLFLTNWTFFIQAVVICLVMYFITRQVFMGTGDRKIIFGLTLQYGGMLGILLMFAIIFALYIKGRNTKSLALIPVIALAYVVWIVYLATTGNLT
jgi:hypothetical protein